LTVSTTEAFLFSTPSDAQFSNFSSQGCKQSVADIAKVTCRASSDFFQTNFVIFGNFLEFFFLV
jgi:hypothetical protein